MVQEPYIVLGMVTRGRPQAAIDCVNSAFDTFGKGTLKVIVALDDDDESGQIISKALHTNKHVSTLMLKPRHYYVRGMNATFLGMRKIHKDMDHFAITNDDVTFKLPGWGTKAIETLHSIFPEGMGVLEMAGFQLCAHFVSRRRLFMERFYGNLFNPVYTQQCCDTELRDLLIEQKLYACPGKGVEPPVVHHVTEDAVRKEWNYWTPWDRATFKQRVTDGLVPATSVTWWLDEGQIIPGGSE